MLRITYRLAMLVCVLFLGESCSDLTSGGDGINEKWYRLQPGYSNAQPAVLGSVVFFGTGDGQIIARDVNTGAVKWSATVGNGAVAGANLVVRNGVLVAPLITNTVALDAQTGAARWRYAAPDDTTDQGTGAAPGSVVRAHIDADGKTVFIPAWGASVSAVDLRTGVVRWVWRPGIIAGDTAASGVFRSGAMGVKVSGDTVFTTMWHYVARLGVPSEAWVVAIDKLSGAELWRVRLPYQSSGVLIWATPAVYHNLVIVHTLTGRTYAIDRVTQTISWEFTPPGYLYSTVAGPELFGDQVYVDGGDGNIYALHAADGTQIWSFTFGSQAITDMLATPRRLLFSQGMLMYVLDRSTGLLVASTGQPHTTDPLFASPAAFSQGLVFVSVADAAFCFEEP